MLRFCEALFTAEHPLVESDTPRLSGAIGHCSTPADELLFFPSLGRTRRIRSRPTKTALPDHPSNVPI